MRERERDVSFERAFLAVDENTRHSRVAMKIESAEFAIDDIAYTVRVQRSLTFVVASIIRRYGDDQV